jgi:hypothetical protein
MDDAAEMVRFNFGGGPGLLANAHVTRCLALGAGAYDARRLGFRNGYGWLWDERRYDFNLIIPLYGWEDVMATTHGSMPETVLRGDQHDRLPPGEDPGFFGWAEMPLTLNNPNRGWFEVSLNLHFILIGIDVGIDAGEIVDYVVGWFGFDPAGDDAWTGKDVEKHDPEPAPRPPKPDTGLLTP